MIYLQLKAVVVRIALSQPMNCCKIRFFVNTGGTISLSWPHKSYQGQNPYLCHKQTIILKSEQ